MAESQVSVVDRSYTCTFGCGNYYDYILTNVDDSTTLFLCVPCFLNLAIEIAGTVTGATVIPPDASAEPATPSGHNVPDILTGDLFAEDD